MLFYEITIGCATANLGQWKGKMTYGLGRKVCSWAECVEHSTYSMEAFLVLNTKWHPMGEERSWFPYEKHL